MPDTSHVRLIEAPLTSARPRAAVRIEARTVDLMRSLLAAPTVRTLFPYSVPELEALLPPADLFRSGMEPLYELCWQRGGVGDPLAYCDRIAYHEGLCSWEPETSLS